MSDRKPKLKAPRGACDTHMHFYDQGVPGAPGTFLPGHFPVEPYQAMQKRLGLERVIVVQPNAYADDNRVTLDAMKKFGKGAKGNVEMLRGRGEFATRVAPLTGRLDAESSPRPAPDPSAAPRRGPARPPAWWRRTAASGGSSASWRRSGGRRG